LNLSSRNFMAFLTDGISEDSERNWLIDPTTNK
jgi:hypothetical protein